MGRDVSYCGKCGSAMFNGKCIMDGPMRKRLTPYQRAGFNELSLFVMRDSVDGLTRDDIVFLSVDDGTRLPKFANASGGWGCAHFDPPTSDSVFAQALSKDADGYYLWDGGECPVPGDWVITARDDEGHRWSEWLADDIGGCWEGVTAFKPISRPDMPVHDGGQFNNSEQAESVDEFAEAGQPQDIDGIEKGFEDFKVKQNGGLIAQDVTLPEADDHIMETFHPLGESDPYGTDAHSPGAKLDAGKNRLSLVLHGFANALSEVGRVGTYGANKYTDNGWVSVPNGQERYTDAMYRHLLAEAKGEKCDPDTSIRHAAHTAWNALARLELALKAES